MVQQEEWTSGIVYVLYNKLMYVHNVFCFAQYNHVTLILSTEYLIGIKVHDALSIFFHGRCEFLTLFLVNIQLGRTDDFLLSVHVQHEDSIKQKWKHQTTDNERRKKNQISLMTTAKQIVSIWTCIYWELRFALLAREWVWGSWVMSSA